MQQFWTEERQDSLRVENHLSLRSDFPELMVGIVCLLNLTMVIVRLAINGELGSIPNWVTGTFLLIPTSFPFMCMVEFTIVSALILMVGKVFGITGWDTIISLPVWYVTTVCTFLLIGIMSLLDPLLFVCAQALWVVCFSIFFEERRKWRNREKKRIQAALAEKKAAEEKASVEKTTPAPQVPKKHCEICGEESIYDICLICERKYRAERHRVRAQVFRAKQAGVPATLTLKEWLDIVEGFHGLCAYCQRNPYVALEHFIPIVAGGGTTADNCVPSCTACNSKKSVKHPDK